MEINYTYMYILVLDKVHGNNYVVCAKFKVHANENSTKCIFALNKCTITTSDN